MIVNQNTSFPWRVYPLREIADIKPGYAPRAQASLTQEYGTVPIIRPSDFNNTKEVTPRIFTTWERLKELEIQNQVLTQERLLLIVYGEKVGIVSVIRGAAIYPHTIAAIMPKNPQFVDIEFLFYSLRYQYSVLQNGTTGSTLPRIHTSFLSELSIPIPSPQRQKQVVKQLDSHLRIIQHLYRLVAEAQRSYVAKAEYALLQQAFHGVML